MKTSLENETLILFFEGEINSSTAMVVEEDVEKSLQNKKFKALVLDFGLVSYVSSAGLRIVLKLKQRYDDVSIVNASLEVYDVLNMTGFTNIMPISKALRVIDISNATVVGEGYFSTVYRVNKDTIIKVFKRTNNIKDIEKELNLAKQAFILGIPTAISFDIVKVGEKYGVVFEMLDNLSLRDLFLQNPDKYDDLVDKYVALLKKINNTEPIDDNLPSAKEAWLSKLAGIKNYLDEKDYKHADKLLRTIPERNTFVHGDCHFKNIITQNHELFLIDMDTLSKGHFIFELASIYAPYVAFEEDDPGNTKRFLGLEPDFTKKLFKDIVVRYLGKDEQSIFDKIKIVSYIHMMWWNRVNEPENNVRLNGCKSRLLNLLSNYKDLIVE